MNSSMTVQAEPEVTLQNIRPVSDLGPHVEVTQIRIEKIRFMWFVLLWKKKKKSYLYLESTWDTFACSLNIV